MPVMRVRKHLSIVRQGGFTLIELAIVLFIVSLLLSGMLLPLSAQQDVRSFGETQKILVEARDALFGFAMANDRLPCPASASSNGVEVFCTAASGACAETTAIQSHGRCAYSYSGFFPAVTLGMAPVDSQGYLSDGWGGEANNRVRYAITKQNTFAFTAISGMKNTGMTSLTPDLQICTTGVGISVPTADTATCAATKSLATDAVAVVYSLGKNAGSGGAGTDENHNPNPQSTLDSAGDRAFVNAPQGSNFDDQMVWLSKSMLFNRMVAAGRLP